MNVKLFVIYPKKEFIKIRGPDTQGRKDVLKEGKSKDEFKR